MTGRSARLKVDEVPSMEFRHDGACRDEDPELFFPTGTSGPALRQVARAKAVCLRCPVLEQCREWALQTGQDRGVWGGLSEEDRAEIRRRKYRK